MTGGLGGGSARRLTVSGAYFVDPDGQLFIRRSITGFCSPKRVMEGRLTDLRRFDDWVAAKRLTEKRVFSRVDWTGPPNSGVETGWEYDESACGAVLEEAAARGLHVEMVAHTGAPPGWSIDQMVDHLGRVDELCLRYDNALLEVWNEPQQNPNLDTLHEVLSRYRPRTPGWASGAYTLTPYTKIVQVGTNSKGDPIYAATSDAIAGESMTDHSDRKYEWSRCFKDPEEFRQGSGPSAEFSPKFLKPVMLDEPPQVEQTIRDYGAALSKDDWRAYGAGSKFFGCGGLIHSNPDFQQCVVPTNPDVLACVDAFVAGFDDVPTQRYERYDRGDPPGPDPGSRRYFRWDEAGQQYEICVRPYSFRRV